MEVDLSLNDNEQPVNSVKVGVQYECRRSKPFFVVSRILNACSHGHAQAGECCIGNKLVIACCLGYYGRE